MKGHENKKIYTPFQSQIIWGKNGEKLREKNACHAW